MMDSNPRLTVRSQIRVGCEGGYLDRGGGDLSGRGGTRVEALSCACIIRGRSRTGQSELADRHTSQQERALGLAAGRPAPTGQKHAWPNALRNSAFSAI